MNYFELFEFDVAPIIDKSLLTKKYLLLQKQYHPDNYSLSDENEQNQYYDERSEIIEKNVLTTLKTLFNTAPSDGNVSTSYNYVLNEGPLDMRFPNFSGLFMTPERSYLELKGRKFNFTKLVWLNDMLNNPEYYELYQLYG